MGSVALHATAGSGAEVTATSFANWITIMVESCELAAIAAVN